MRPGVLHVQAEVVFDPLRRPLRRVVDENGYRKAITILLDQIHAVLERSLVAVPPGPPLHPGLERVRAGHVRQRTGIGIPDGRPEVVRTLGRAPGRTRGAVEARDVGRADTRLRLVGRIGLVVFREASFNQPSATERTSVLGLRRVVELRAADAAGLLGVERRTLVTA